MDRLTQFFRSIRTLVLFGTLAISMLPWPGITRSAVADEIPVGADAGVSAKPAFHALVDLNGDGFADLIYTLDLQTNVYVQYSNGATFGAPVIVATDSSTSVQTNCTEFTCHHVAQAVVNAVGDVNGDGLPDILFGDGTVALGIGSGFGPKMAWSGDASLSGGTWVGTPAFHALADINGDGFADLIYTLKFQTNVYVQYSNGTSFAAPIILATDSSTRVQVSCGNVCHYAAQALINAVGDVNGDGRPDILFADGTVALGNGSGFGPKTAWGGDTSLSGGTCCQSLVFHGLADINDDGFADLIYTLPLQTNVYVQYSNGAAFGAPVIVNTDSSTSVQTNCTEFTCHHVAQAVVNAVGDINGDRHADILYANGSATIFPVTYVLKPKYFISSVFYVPPGQGPSTITYAQGTVVGTTVSTTNSWSVQASAGAQIGTNALTNFIGADTTITFGANFSGSTTNSVDMQSTFNIGKPYKGVASDLVNHDYDQVLIYAGVNVNATVDGTGAVTWGMDFSHVGDNFAENGYPITVGCLRPVSTIPAGECDGTIAQLQALGITPDDYPNILGADPFADPSTAPTTIDSCRYVEFYSYNYFPLPVPTPSTETVTNSVTGKTSQTRGYEYSVSVEVDTGFILGKMKDSAKFTWGNSSTTSTSTGTTNMSQLVLWPPVSLVSTLYAYQDTIYKTLMFSFVPPSPPCN